MTQPTRYHSQFPDRAVRSKTHEVAAYHKDETLPGKPLHLLVPGGLVALASLALIVWSLYAGYIEYSIAGDTALTLACLLAPVYAGGVFLFAYGYELYDVPKALRLTAIVVFLTFAVVLIVAVLAILLFGDKDGHGSLLESIGRTGSKGGGLSIPSGTAASGGSSVTHGAGSVVGGVLDGMTDAAYGVGRVAGSMPPVMLDVSPTVTNEVIKEVPVEAPAPQPISCPFCGRSYIPAQTKYACPNCGAATPPELLAPGEGPSQPASA